MKNPKSLKLTLKPEYGYKINWVFSSRLKTSISVGVLGAAGVVLVIKARKYLEFSSSDQYEASPRYWAVPGLENLGNNCFLNVVLQALASCSSFRKYLTKLVEESEQLANGEGDDEDIPLIKSLTSLIEELCTLQHKRTAINPRRLMLAMDHYIPSFNLTRQQDAEEAFSHLLSSLREEISEHCFPIESCLADLPTLSNRRIFITKSSEESKWQRWSRIFLQPFDGILGSILICQSCSFQISLDFQMFHSLHLSPPTSSQGSIMAGCTLQDCLKQFFAAEHVENYCCSNCWHTAAIEYLSAFAQDKTDIEKLEHCNKNDSCDCKSVSSLEAFPWSNRFSRTFKQLSVARSPKILCLHLQRASYNMFGQSVKLAGHVSFPLILDLSPFVSAGVGIKKMAANSSYGSRNHNSMHLRPFPYSMYQNLLPDPIKLYPKANTTESIASETEVAGKQESDVIPAEDGSCLGDSDMNPCSVDTVKHDGGNANITSPSSPYRHQMYRLVSAVVHYGSSGSGHYTVFRKVTARIGDDDPVALLESAIEQWFSISDSDVQIVSEKDVLDANASMLFYEKID